MIKSSSMLQRAIAVSFSIGCVLGNSLFAVDSDADASTKPVSSASQANRNLVVICGLPGDEDHRSKMTKALRQIAKSSKEVLWVDDAKRHWLVGDEAMRLELASDLPSSQIATQDSISNSVRDLATKLTEKDEVVFLLIGHCHLQGGLSQFNVSGPDVDQKMFGEWTNQIRASQVYWLASSLSGYWIKPLSGNNRIVITATEAGPEITAVEMPFVLADILAGESEQAILRDVDEDGAISLLDLYLASAMEIERHFRSDDWLMTEHAQLDDNGDRRGSELQVNYLPDPDAAKEETPGEGVSEPVAKPKPAVKIFLDGKKAKSWLIGKGMNPL